GGHVREPLDDLGRLDASAVDMVRHQLFGNWRDAMIRRQRDDVAPATDGTIEVLEQRAERRVQPRQVIADFPAPGAELVTDAIEAGEADAQQVDAVVRSELELVDQRRRHGSEIRIGERARIPLRSEW